MLFNTYQFLLVFLPALIFVSFLVRRNAVAYKLTLVTASLVFYAHASLPNLFLFVGSIVFNFVIAAAIRGFKSQTIRSAVLGVGITANLASLFYYKYAAFAFGLFGQSFVAGSSGVEGLNVALPLAISFYTFEQIYFLLETHRGRAEKWSFIDYATFITFFPKLIAGPVVRPSVIIDQLKSYNSDRAHFDTGLMIFVAALAKKVLIADSLARFIDPVFHDKELVSMMSGVETWSFALLGTLQLYFDYSAYCDMAIGIGLMLGIVLPLNFNSPLRSRDLVEFWTRWNISVTKFLTETIFYPVSVFFARQTASWKGAAGKYVLAAIVPIALTFLVSGIWHGAGINYIYFGLTNAVGLIAVKLLQKFHFPKMPFLASWAVTMAYVAITHLCFRVTDLEMLHTIFRHLFTPSYGYFYWTFSLHEKIVIGSIILGGFGFVLLMPNLSEIFARDIYKPKKYPEWLARVVEGVSLSPWGRAGLAAVTFLSFVSILNPTFFIYFMF